MARNKKKKKKQSSKSTVRLSPAAYIRHKARNLPISKCYVQSLWKDTGMSSVFVTRAHKNGNLTVGLYLVDLKCLGIKYALYQFNIPGFRLQEMLSQSGGGSIIECDYTLAHNIIYGSKKYAEKFGFQPHKDWAVSQYILEPDDESTPLIDIEFGDDGKPHYISGPGDDIHFINNVERTLEKSAGKDNYHITLLKSQYLQKVNTSNS